MVVIGTMWLGRFAEGLRDAVCGDGMVMKVRVCSLKTSRPLAILTPQALQRVFGPSGLRLHRGVWVQLQLAQVR